jgi:hypothetical protein
MLNQVIAVAVAEKVGVLETAEDFLRRRAGKSKEWDLLSFARKAGRKALGVRTIDSKSEFRASASTFVWRHEPSSPDSFSLVYAFSV